jgi:hypothetical protein
MFIVELLVGLLWNVLIVGAIIYVIYRVARRASPPKEFYNDPQTDGTGLPADAAADSRDAMWRHYIASFQTDKLTKAEAAMLERILAGPHAPDALAGTDSDWTGVAPAAVRTARPAVTGQLAVPEPPADMEAPAAVPSAVQRDIDGTSLLLYFGAFLFVAAAGLFVAFGGFSGGVRTLTVLVTIAVLYFGGFWLYERSSKLRPAGVTFTAIGMALAPLAGVAAYYFIAGGSYGPFIWLLTSLLCLGLYVNALLKLRYAFITYLFIFSFVSLFESAVSILHAPVHYYIWGLIVAGMILRAIGLKKSPLDIEEPTDVSAQLIVPLSLVVSLAVTGRQGFGQLAVTLLLAATYYALEARNQPKMRTGLAVSAQVLYLAGIATGVYAVSHSVMAVAVAFLALTAVQAVVVLLTPRQGELSSGFASVAFASVLPAIAFALPNGTMMSAGLAAGVVMGGLVAMRQRRPDAFTGAAIMLAALPYAVGQLALKPSLGGSMQTALAFVPVLIIWAAWSWFAARKASKSWLDGASAVYAVAGAVAVFAGLFAGGWTGIIAAAVFSLTLALAARGGAGNGWWSAAGAVVTAPVVFGFMDIHSLHLTVALLLALVMNITMTLLSREEPNRWLVTILGLLLPVGVGAGGLGWHFGTAAYAYSYIVVMAGLVFCRAVARGVYFPSSKIPIMSYYRSTSMSYVIGYVVAAGLAVLISLGSGQSHLHTSVILALLILLTGYIALKVEKHLALLALLPWLGAALLISAVRPPASEAAATFVVLAVSIFAIVVYAVVETMGEYFGKEYDDVVHASLALVYLPVVLCMWYAVNKYVPALALAIAGMETFYFARNRTQADREASGAIVVIALMWALVSAGIHNTQAYTHIIAAVCGLYAYWRYVRGDFENSDNYLKAMLAVATIPLALQAIGGQAGDAYGWWLLMEQVGFILLGVTIGRKFVTMWGLYVALGAVLYQLRNLGWAALTLLALFVIGVAVYRLQKQNIDHHD